MASGIRNVIVVGGSYVGKATALELARVIPPTHRVLLIEPHSHFNHLFVFPRFAVLPGHEHKAFIPYSSTFASVPNSSLHSVVPARVLSVQPKYVEIDREWQGSNQVPFDYLTIATGTSLVEPASMRYDDKASSAAYLKSHQDNVKRSKSIVVVGGGAVGVQMATDLKEIYPDKEITVVHSRAHLMPLYHEKMHEIIKRRFDELGVRLITGSRVVIPTNGFPKDESDFVVELTNGTKLKTDFVILATGQKPNNRLIQDLVATARDSLINPKNGFIRVKPTLQFLDSQYPNLFAVGDIADTGMHKAARPGSLQAAAVAKNIQALIEGRDPEAEISWSPPGIHMSLGLKYNIVFRNPNPAEGQNEPVVKYSDDGKEDLNVESMWTRMGVQADEPGRYHL
ncbi:putative amid-like NADH oxidoreductase [Talaromyces proteolyticus]|uniref:Amid-like NADH oxidoreductase n=1 Tax=Talaromyces proteolyticus TaxID=1131652 RepID=A0AAD4Q3H3_9EURO|nr:putative amid-like NADH oxidoreductase [Talaromyces proteolyticus]KAH8701781.1 putative amid-like NADH oxidoreductase [Talaromyces proteolyticus]